MMMMMMIILIMRHEFERQWCDGGSAGERKGELKDTKGEKDQNMLHVYVQDRIMKPPNTVQ
jgi:hypothetical protein